MKNLKGQDDSNVCIQVSSTSLHFIVHPEEHQKVKAFFFFFTPKIIFFFHCCSRKTEGSLHLIEEIINLISRWKTGKDLEKINNNLLLLLALVHKPIELEVKRVFLYLSSIINYKTRLGRSILVFSIDLEREFTVF